MASATSRASAAAAAEMLLEAGGVEVPRPQAAGVVGEQVEGVPARPEVAERGAAVLAEEGVVAGGALVAGDVAVAGVLAEGRRRRRLGVQQVELAAVLGVAEHHPGERARPSPAMARACAAPSSIARLSSGSR